MNHIYQQIKKKTVQSFGKTANLRSAVSPSLYFFLSVQRAKRLQTAVDPSPRTYESTVHIHMYLWIRSRPTHNGDSIVASRLPANRHPLADGNTTGDIWLALLKAVAITVTIVTAF